MVAIYHELLADIPFPQLDAACRQVTQTARFFPKPADILGAINEANFKAQQVEAEEDWKKALDYAARWYDADLGVNRRAPALPPKLEKAINDAGGLRRLWGCPEKELQFARKDFFASYSNLSALEQVQDLLPSGSDAKKIICRLTAAPKQLAPRVLSPVTVPTAAEPLAPDDPIRAEFAALREQLSRPQPVPTKTEAEFESRRELLKRQAAQILDETRKTA